jgi:hypothetical protein
MIGCVRVRLALTFALVTVGVSPLAAQDLGRAEPPFVEATTSMPVRWLGNPEKRADMVRDLSEKSEMNYRLLALKIMEQWQNSMKSQKTFMKDLMQHRLAAFTVKKNGEIVIEGTDPPAAQDDVKTKGKRQKARTLGDAS